MNFCVLVELSEDAIILTEICRVLLYLFDIRYQMNVKFKEFIPGRGLLDTSILPNDTKVDYTSGVSSDKINSSSAYFVNYFLACILT